MLLRLDGIAFRFREPKVDMHSRRTSFALWSIPTRVRVETGSTDSPHGSGLVVKRQMEEVKATLYTINLSLIFIDWCAEKSEFMSVKTLTFWIYFRYLYHLETASTNTHPED
jgi:hypothetical protein